VAQGFSPAVSAALKGLRHDTDVKSAITRQQVMASLRVWSEIEIGGARGFGLAERPSPPAEIVPRERQVAVTLARDLEDRFADR
jgi:hypothetical protein